MYLATAPAAGPAATEPGGRITLPLSRIISRAFRARDAFGAAGLEIIADLAASYRVPFPDEHFTRGARTTFTDMVRTLVPDLRDGEQIGLIVLAHGVADAEPEWPACYLSGVLPGSPLSFAVADAGIVTPFQALRIAAEYIRADQPRRAAVIILDQTSLLRDTVVNPDTPCPTENRMVALVFEEAGGIGAVSVSMTPDVSPPSADDLLRERLRDRTADGAAPAMVVGGHLAAASTVPLVTPAVTAPAGLPCTGLWVEFADRLPGWRAGGATRVELVDYDRTLRTLGRCVVDLDVPGRAG